MLSDIGTIIASSFSSPLTKTLIGSASAIVDGNFSSEVIAQQVMAIAKDSPKIDMSEVGVRNVVDLIRDEVRRIGPRRTIDIPAPVRHEPPAPTVVLPTEGPGQQLVPNGPAPRIAPANLPPMSPANTKDVPDGEGAGVGSKLISPYFKLVLLILTGLTVLSGLIAFLLTFVGNPGAPSQMDLAKTFGSAFTAGLTALIAFVGGKAL